MKKTLRNFLIFSTIITLLACNSNELYSIEEQKSIERALIKKAEADNITLEKIEILTKVNITESNLDSIKNNAILLYFEIMDKEQISSIPTDTLVNKFNKLFNFNTIASDKLGTLFFTKVIVSKNNIEEFFYAPIILNKRNNIPSKIDDLKQTE